MIKMIILGVVAALTLSLPLPLWAQREADVAKVENVKKPRPPENAEDLEKKSREAYETGNYVLYYIANMKLHELLPYEPEYLYRIVNACALLGRKTTAYHYMLIMQQQGLSYDFNQTEDSIKIRDTEVYTYLNDLMIEAGRPSGDGEVAFTLSEEVVDPAVIVWDGSRQKFLVGTQRTGSIHAVTADGKTEELLRANDENGLWAIGGLIVDEASNRLWVSSTPKPEFSGFVPSDLGHGALFEFNLKTLELIDRYNLPVDGQTHELGSMAMTEDGLIYIVDRAIPIVYRKLPGQDKLEAFVSSSELVALRDIAVTPDNTRLYVSDHVKGIFVVAPELERAGMLKGPETLNFGGIEGLFFNEGNLVIIQSGIRPQRLVSLELNADGDGVASVSPLVVAQEQFNHPDFGTLKDRQIYYFANRNAASLGPTIVMRTSVDAGSQYVPAEQRKIKAELLSKEQDDEQDS